MNKPKATALAAIGAVAAMILAACGSSGNSPSGSSGSASHTTFNQAVNSVVNPSNHKGGTLSLALTSGPDSLDPGNTYYAYMWNFTRLYAMPLMTYKSCPGSCGLQLTPALATAPGVVSGHGLLWTYHIKPNIKFEDGATVTSSDVKYAVERTYARNVLTNGPTYFQVLLKDPTYPGPYKDRAKNLMGLTSVTTPNPTTVVFHLAKPFADFDYIAAIPQTAPVPPNKDTGAKYQLHPQSTGPYKFVSYQLNKELTMVPNPEWKASTDPAVKQLPSKITVSMFVNANDIDNRQLAGDLSLDMDGTGVQAAARAKILSSSTLKAESDDPIAGFNWFVYIDDNVPPFNNIACRKAVEYAANKTNLQTAYGGPFAGNIASTMLVPTVVGYKSFDLYGALSKPGGNLPAAKAALKACGHPNGFSTNIAYRSDRPKEVAAATALQAALGQIGIKTQLHGYPSGTYFSTFAGVPKYVHQHDLGLLFGGWAADFPTAWGFLDEISNGNAISQTGGNTNIEELNNPTVNKLLAQFESTLSPTTRDALASQIDMAIMKQAVMLPEVYAKSLLYRSPSLTNVYVQPYYGMYNYAVLGVK